MIREKDGTANAEQREKFLRLQMSMWRSHVTPKVVIVAFHLEIRKKTVCTEKSRLHTMSPAIPQLVPQEFSICHLEWPKGQTNLCQTETMLLI
jgi:hypothetical protein